MNGFECMHILHLHVHIEILRKFARKIDLPIVQIFSCKLDLIKLR